MNRVLQVLLPVAVVGAGVVVAAGFVTTAPKTKKAASPVEATLVEVLTAEAGRRPVEVTGMGTVVAAQQVDLQAEVGGRVVDVSPHLVSGGRVKKGETLFRIDRRDYDLVVQQRQADVQRAEFEIAQERGRARVAEKEWKLLDNAAPATPEGRSLALREPQLKAATAALASAKSGLAKARLDVQRTRVTAPFNAFVKSETVDLGRLVDRQAKLGELVGTDAVWVQVSLPVADLKWIRLPDAEGRGGSEATIVQTLEDGGTIERSARVLRLAGDLDPKGRMARLIVAVDAPMDPPQGQLPLLLGAYVQARVVGAPLDAVVALPRRAVRDGNEVWVMNAKDELEIRQVAVAYRGDERVLVKSGVRDGERVVVSRLAAPVAGMALRTLDRGAEPETAAAETAVKAEAK